MSLSSTGAKPGFVSSWTMAKEGSKRVEIARIDDKRQITIVFGGTMTASTSDLLRQNQQMPSFHQVPF